MVQSAERFTTPAPGEPHPDKVTLWPSDRTTFWADVTFRGDHAYDQALLTEERVLRFDLRVDVRQDSDGAWTVRAGPAAVTTLLALLREVVH